MYKYFMVLMLCALQLSCSGSKGSTYSQNKFVHEFLLDRYFWYQEVPLTVDYNDFDSPQQTLDFLKFHELDRFSYITDADEFRSLFNLGQTVKYGFSFFVESDDSVRIKFAFDDSAAGRVGLQRGDQILSINNQTVQDIITSIGWSDIFGPDEVGYPVDMLIQKNDGSVVDVHMEKSVVNINTVLHHSIIDNGTDKTGYLVFNSFLNTSNEELVDVFSEFNAEGVNKLILDLRYNGGGSVSVARNLASYLTITDSVTDVFALLKQNDKYLALNGTYFFKTMENELDLDRVTVITTGATASASEMVINGLKPFVDVKTVGSKTYGKPVGMNPVEFDDKVILAITFASYNQDGEGEYFGGIAVDCVAGDDLSFAFGDSTAPMLSEAIFVSQNNSCSSNKPGQKNIIENRQKTSYSIRNIIDVY